MSLFSNLARASLQAEERSAQQRLEGWRDDLSHLPNERLVAWKQILASVRASISAEKELLWLIPRAVEGHPLTPLAEDEQAFLHAYLRDLERHEKLVRGYMQKTFPASPRRSATPQPRKKRFAGLLERALDLSGRPVYSVALLDCYTGSMAESYEALSAQAQADGAQNLLSLLRLIAKDKTRHHAGMSALLTRSRESGGGKFSLIDRGAIRVLLTVLSVQARGQKIGARFKRIGLDEASVHRVVSKCADETLKRVL